MKDRIMSANQANQDPSPLTPLPRVERGRGEGRGPLLPALSGPLLGLIGVLVLFTLLIGRKGELQHFWSLPNIQVLFHEITIPGIVALGALLVILSGGI